jgi:hypothetical protein
MDSTDFLWTFNSFSKVIPGKDHTCSKSLHAGNLYHHARSDIYPDGTIPRTRKELLACNAQRNNSVHMTCKGIGALEFFAFTAFECWYDWSLKLIIDIFDDQQTIAK